MIEEPKLSTDNSAEYLGNTEKLETATLPQTPNEWLACIENTLKTLNNEFNLNILTNLEDLPTELSNHMKFKSEEVNLEDFFVFFLMIFKACLFNNIMEHIEDYDDQTKLMLNNYNSEDDGEKAGLLALAISDEVLKKIIFLPHKTLSLFVTALFMKIKNTSETSQIS